MSQCKHGYYEVLCTQCDEEEVAAMEKTNPCTDASQEQSFEEWWKNHGYMRDQTYRGPAEQAWDNRAAHYRPLLAVAEDRVLHYRRECEAYRDRIAFLEGMIDNGLGWEDMKDDH